MLNTLSTKAYIAATEAVRSGIQRFKQNESGVTAIEYGLIAICITAFIIYVFYSDNGFVQKMADKFDGLTSTIGSLDETKYGSAASSAASSGGAAASN